MICIRVVLESVSITQDWLNHSRVSWPYKANKVVLKSVSATKDAQGQHFRKSVPQKTHKVIPRASVSQKTHKIIFKKFSATLNHQSCSKWQGIHRLKHIQQENLPECNCFGGCVHTSGRRRWLISYGCPRRGSLTVIMVWWRKDLDRWCPEVGEFGVCGADDDGGYSCSGLRSMVMVVVFFPGCVVSVFETDFFFVFT